MDLAPASPLRRGAAFRGGGGGSGSGAISSRSGAFSPRSGAFSSRSGASPPVGSARHGGEPITWGPLYVSEPAGLETLHLLWSAKEIPALEARARRDGGPPPTRCGAGEALPLDFSPPQGAHREAWIFASVTP